MKRISGLFIVVICFAILCSKSCFAESIIEEAEESQNTNSSHDGSGLDVNKYFDNGEGKDKDATTTGNYVFEKGFFQDAGTAYNSIVNSREDDLVSIEFQDNEWEGSSFSFLLDPHYCFAVYSNADIEYMVWNDYVRMGNLLVPEYQLKNGLKLHLRVLKGEQAFSVGEVLPIGTYSLIISDESGVVYASQLLNIIRQETPVQLTEGKTIDFDITHEEENVVYSFQPDNYAVNYPLDISIQSGNCFLYCLWDNGEYISFSLFDYVLFETGTRETVVLAPEDQGCAYFIIVPVEEQIVAGSLCINTAETFRSGELIDYTQELSYESVILGKTVSFNAKITYDNEVSEELKTWTVDHENNRYCCMSKSGAPLYICLVNKDDEIVSLPQKQLLSGEGTYYWSLRYPTNDGFIEVQKREVIFKWDGETQCSNDEITEVTLDEQEGESLLIDTTSDSSWSIGWDNNPGNPLILSLYKQDGDVWSLIEEEYGVEGYLKTYELEAGTYRLVAFNNSDSNGFQLRIKKKKEINGVSIDSTIPGELSYSEIVNNNYRIDMKECVSVTVSYVDGDSEVISNWKKEGTHYYGTTTDSTRVILYVIEKETNRQVSWDAWHFPIPGEYHLFVKIDNVSATSDSVRILSEDSPYRLDSNDSVIVTLDQEEAIAVSTKEKRSVQCCFDNIDAVVNCSIYWLQQNTVNLYDRWTIEDGDSHFITFQQGTYIFVFAKSIQGGQISVKQRKEIGIIGLEAAIESSYEVNSNLSDLDNATASIGVTDFEAIVNYDDGTNEEITLNGKGDYIQLQNGQMLSVGIVITGEDGIPTINKREIKYRKIAEELAVGFYAICPIIDGEPDLHSYIDFTITPHEHVWDGGEIIENAGCVNAGTVKYTCTKYQGHTKEEDIPPLGHCWGEWVVTKNATIYEVGNETRSCERCGLIENREIEKLEKVTVTWDGNGVQVAASRSGDPNEERYVYDSIRTEEYAKNDYLNNNTVAFNLFFKDIPRGKKFAGWSLDGTKDTIQTFRDEQGNQIYQLTDDVTFKAVWVDSAFITWDANGAQIHTGRCLNDGTGIYDTVRVDEEEKDSILPHDPPASTDFIDIPEGREFKGWSSDGTEGNIVSFTDANGHYNYSVTGDVTFKAVWAYNADYQAANAVIAKINDIGTVMYTDTCKAKIDVARIAYNALTATQKNLVSNANTLTVAETRYTTLKEEAEQSAANQTVANAVIIKINAIGTVTYTDASKSKIDAARTAYSALTAAQKKLVSNYESLITAENKYIELKNNVENNPNGENNQSGEKPVTVIAPSAENQPAIIIQTISWTPPTIVQEPITISKAPTSVKAKAKMKKVTVSWSKIKKTKITRQLLAQIKSVQVQYSTDPTFAQNTVAKTVGKSRTKVVLKLQKKTTYYIRVRYKGADGVSRWSGVKRVTTK